MKSELQLMLNIEENSCQQSLEEKLALACESMDKVRRKIFSEMAILKKEMQSLKIENERLKSKIEDLKNDSKQSTKWIYRQEGCLFTMRDSKAI